jgi:hypothetical protein
MTSPGHYAEEITTSALEFDRRSLRPMYGLDKWCSIACVLRRSENREAGIVDADYRAPDRTAVVLSAAPNTRKLSRRPTLASSITPSPARNDRVYVLSATVDR